MLTHRPGPYLRPFPCLPQDVARAYAQFYDDEAGGGSVEYGILLGLLAAAVLSIVARLSDPFKDMYGRITSCIQQASQC